MNWPSPELLLSEARSALPTLPPLRDMALFESAVGAARNIEAYESNDPFRVAAHLVVKVIQNHPFVDGNKRFSWICGCVFLALNDLPVPSLQGRGQYFAVELLKNTAKGETGVEEISSFFAGAAGTHGSL